MERKGNRRGQGKERGEKGERKMIRYTSLQCSG